jgi:Predicted membrane protein (DUF2142)
MASPPGSPFDEPAHYVKAVGAGRGELLGEPAAPSAAQRRAFLRGAASGSAAVAALARQSHGRIARFQSRTARQFDVPRTLLAPGFGCTYFGREITGACLDRPRPRPPRGPAASYAGTYQPYVYVPAGLALRAAASPEAALRLGRAAILAICAVLLVAAVWLLWSPASPGTSLLGLATAVTPMVLFTSSVLSPSGPEVAGAVCFAAGLLRLGREEEPPRWIWLALGASGAVLASARALGPAFVALLIAAIAVLVGPGTLAARARPRAWAAAAAVLAAATASVVWDFGYQPRPSPTGSSLGDAIGPSIENLPSVVREAIGVFGALDAPMPGVGHLAWLALLGLLGAAALATGTPRERASILILLAAALAVTLGMSLFSYREIGPLQGRYVLPFLVLLPLWIGEVLHRHRERVPAALVAGTFAVTAAVQALGWLANGHRFAVGQSGSWLFPFDAEWSLPYGWIPWALLAGAALGAYLAATLLALRRSRSTSARTAQPAR